MTTASNFAGLIRVTAPTYEPISLGDALLHLRIDASDEDAVTYVTGLLSLARQYCEDFLRRSLMTQTWRLSLKNWPGRDYENWPRFGAFDIDYYYKYNFIRLPMPPLQSVTSVSYRKSDGTTSTMAFANFAVLTGYSYNVEKDFEPGRIVLPYSGVWPPDVLMPGAPIQITYVAGYIPLANDTSPAVGPTFEAWEGYRAVLHAMKLLIAYWYEVRLVGSTGTTEFNYNQPTGEEVTALALLRPHRIF